MLGQIRSDPLSETKSLDGYLEPLRINGNHSGLKFHHRGGSLVVAEAEGEFYAASNDEDVWVEFLDLAPNFDEIQD